MTDLLLGIDIGTSGCKVTAIDTQGRVVDEGFAEYQTSRPRPGWSEQDPEEWRSVAFRLLREMDARGKAPASRIAALGLDGSTHNAVLADERFTPLRPAIMWTDSRSAPQAAALRERFGELIFAATYNMPSPTWTLPQIQWVRENEPETAERIRRIAFTKDYVRQGLTGTWETDHIEAQGSLMFDNRTGAWSEELCGLAGLSRECFPPVVRPTDVVGAVTREAARATGLREGTPVVAGSSDTAVEDYAAGAIEPGQMIVKLATAGNVNVMTAEAHPHRKTITYAHVIRGMWYTAVATNTAASAERWFRELFCEEEAARAREARRNVYELMHEAAAAVAPGCDGLFFHPYLLGERAPYWDPRLRGSFVGATMRHGKGHFVRAVLEGVAYSLRDCFRTICDMNLPVDEIRLIGGGSRSGLWAQIVSDVFARPVARPAGCDASFGSALLAGVGVGLFAGPQDAVRRCTAVQSVLTPGPAAETYATLFGFYRRIHDDLEATYAALDETLAKRI